MKLTIKVSTGKQRFYIKRENKILLIDVKSNPEKGKANLEIIKELFDFKIIRVIETYMKFYNDLIDRDSFIYIPDIRLLPQPVTEKQLYKLIGFTQNEIKELDKF